MVNTVRRIFLVIFLFPALIFSAEDSYKAEVEKWRADRIARLKSEDGWLSLVGLYWLKEGKNRFGSDPSNEIVLPKGPKVAGTLTLDHGSVRLEPDPAAEIKEAGKPVQTIELKTDAGGDPTILNMGSLIFHVIQRGPKLALRVKDKESPVRTNFKGIDVYPLNPAWRIEAKFEPYNPPKKIPILNIIGQVQDNPSPGALVFQVAGKNYRLDTIQEDPKELSIYFTDQTTGHETYGAGRYLETSMPSPDGKVVLDFNKAYNPPCAFTAFATCPLPPPQNKLALRIEAGEKKYASASH